MVLYLPFLGLTGIIFSPLASSATSSYIFIPLHNESLKTRSLLPFGGGEIVRAMFCILQKPMSNDL